MQQDGITALVEKFMTRNRAIYGSARMEDTSAGGAGGSGSGEGGDGGQGAGGYKAPATQADLDKLVGERVARERAKYADYNDLKDKASKYDQHQADTASELEKAVKKARDEAATETRSAVTRERVLDKIEVAAAGKFADTEDARLRVGQRAGDFINRDGSIDQAAITAAVDELLKASPHLAAQQGDGKPLRPRPDGGQGGNNGRPTPGQQGRDMAQKRFGQRATQQA